MQNKRATVIGDDDLEIIRSLPPFRGLASEALRQLIRDAEILMAPRKTVIFERGQPVTHFYGVLSGWVKLFRMQPDGTEVIIEVFGPGESFAEGAICMTDGYPVSAELVEDSRLLAVPVKAYIQRLREDPELIVKTFAALSQNLHRLVSRIESGGLSSSQRVAAFLLQVSKPGHSCPGPLVVKLPYDKKLVAGRLGMKPETFSRALASLKRYGVTVRGSETRIEDLEVLHRHISMDKRVFDR